ncbi:MAG: serine/threonine-protein kinase [Myxococcota bacterium]|nr:serine/threonine-protein kinase [Myxococcota bacterium]
MEFHIGQKIDRYIVEGRIGEGGMAEVYKCKHESLNTLHAVKVVKVSKEEIKQRMIREGQLQATLSHNNIVRVTDILPIQGHPCLVMDFIEGQALDDFLYENRIGLGQAEEIFLQIVDAMAYAHDRNIIHRDLKPANILMELHNGTWTPKVADFGLAKALGTEDSGMTRTGVGIGTPAYMAPEQVRNAKGVDHRADIFSLGTILYEMVTAQLPFMGNDTLELLNAVATRPHKNPLELNPNLPPRIVSAINAALVKDPEKRIQNCADLISVFKGEADFSLKTKRFPTLAFDGSDPTNSGYDTVDNIDVPPPDSPSLNTIQFDTQELTEAQLVHSKGRASDGSTESHPGTQSIPTDISAQHPLRGDPSLHSHPSYPSHPSLPVVQKQKSIWIPIVIVGLMTAAIAAYFGFTGEVTKVSPPVSNTTSTEATTIPEPKAVPKAAYPHLPNAIVASHSKSKTYPQYILDQNPETVWSSSYSKDPELKLQMNTNSQFIKLDFDLNTDGAEAPNSITVGIIDTNDRTLFSKVCSYSNSEPILVDMSENFAFKSLSIKFLTSNPSATISINELSVFTDSTQPKNAVDLNRKSLDDALERLQNPPKVTRPKAPPAIVTKTEPEPEPDPEPEPETEAAARPPPPTTATVRMEGADSISLLQGNTVLPIGNVPAGTYTVRAVFNGTPVNVDTKTFEAGKSYLIKCYPGMNNCRIQ